MPRLVSNPPNPWQSVHTEWLEEPPVAALEVFEEEAHSVLAENKSPDVGFRWSVNPYRGCAHACAYCYARPTHQYLGFGAGTDFDRKIVVKTNAPEVLARELARRSWKRETIVFSGNTDCYQPLEASYALTRRCLEVCADHANPVTVITKGALVRRDIDVLTRIGKRARAQVFVSITFAEDDVGRRMEPGASSPSKRIETLRALSEAGIETGVSLSPLIPGLNESDVPTILMRAKEAGASTAFMTLLRLPAEVLPVFQERVAEAFPDRAKKIESAIRAMRDGRMYQNGWGERMHGSGARWEAVEKLFEIHCRRLGLNSERDMEKETATRGQVRQGDLFGSTGSNG